MPSSESKSAPRLRKILVPFRDEPNFPIEFNFILSAETAERLRIRSDIIFAVDVVEENTHEGGGVLRLKMVDQNGRPCVIAKACLPGSWPQQREDALDFPQEAATALLKEWDPTGPRVQQS